ncbi:MAG TPA: sulfatase-like hydrolase/transferase [Pirellulales bacterium]|nr:sulfatase-like hydrolase/transferase [Pirellulales bacterium]
MRRLAALLLLVVAAPALAAAPARPNILFIYTDDQPYKTLSCYAEAPEWVKTPQIDKLAARGVRFTRAYCGSWCMPSRASLLTGRLPHAIESMTMEGTYPGSTYDPAQCPFWPAELRKRGYQTAQIGKWHTGTDAGFGRDWDYQIVWNRPKHPENAGNYYEKQILAFNGQERETKGYSTDNYTDWAVEYIEGKHRDANKPWYLWLCYGAVHGPTTPAARHRGAYSGNQAPVPADIYGPRPEKPSYLEGTQAWMKGPDGRPAMQKKGKKDNFDVNQAGKSYDAWVQQVNECAMAIDEGVGRVLKALEESGQLENTLVVYTADQGYALGEHGFNMKLAPYDANISSPLIISRPGSIPEGKVCQHPVNSPDLVALFCATTGLELPWKTHGRDIRPLLADPETTKWNQPMLMENMSQQYGSDCDGIPVAHNGVPPWVLLRDGRYKYIRVLDKGEPEEIYDLDADPEELHNLAVRAENRDLLASLRKKAVAELRKTGAGFVDKMPKMSTMAMATDDANKTSQSKSNGKTLVDDSFDSPTIAGRDLAPGRGTWKIADGMATCTQDDKLYEKNKQHGPVMWYDTPMTDGTITFSFRPHECQTFVFTLNNAKGHVFRFVVRPTGLLVAAWPTQGHDAKSLALFKPTPDSPKLVGGQWIDAKLVFDGTQCTLSLGKDFRQTFENSAIGFDKTQLGLGFSFGTLDVRDVKVTTP